MHTFTPSRGTKSMRGREVAFELRQVPGSAEGEGTTCAEGLREGGALPCRCRRKAGVQDGALVVSSRPPGKPLRAHTGDDASPFLQGGCVGVGVPITLQLCAD